MFRGCRKVAAKGWTLTIQAESSLGRPSRLIDHRILLGATGRGRITTVELAPGSAFRPRPVCAGAARSSRPGCIKGYRALLDEKLLGYEVTVFAMVHLRAS